MTALMDPRDHRSVTESPYACDAVLLAGDRGASRTVCGSNKSFLPVNGIPLFLHHVLQTDQTDAIRCVVMGDEVAIDSNQPAATRAAHIWWGPEDVNRDGKLGDAADADWVLQHVTWVGNLTDGAPVNLNHGTQSYHRWGWYDCGLGQGYDYGWFNATNAAADAQYLGVCLASPP